MLVFWLQEALPKDTPEMFCVSNLSRFPDSETFFFTAPSSLGLLSCGLRGWDLFSSNLVSKVFVLSRIGADIFLAGQSQAEVQEMCTYSQRGVLFTWRHITALHITTTPAHIHNWQEPITPSQRQKTHVWHRGRLLKAMQLTLKDLTWLQSVCWTSVSRGHFFKYQTFFFFWRIKQESIVSNIIYLIFEYNIPTLTVQVFYYE